MANKRVNIDAGVHTASTHERVGPGSTNGTDAIDVSHLRPLSEGVLHAMGFHGGLDTEGNVRDLRGHLQGAVELDPFELPSDELHVQWAKLEWTHEGMISRNVTANGMVLLRFAHGDGDVITGKGETTREAFGALAEKMGGTK